MPSTTPGTMPPVPADSGSQFAVGSLATIILRLAGRLEDTARRLHAGDDLTVAERGFLLHLRQGGWQTIPQLAARRGATRQYVQHALVPLVECGLVEWQENPRHRRSRLATLTPAGTTLARRLMAREGALMRELSTAAERPNLARATATLAALEEALEGALAAALAAEPPAGETTGRVKRLQAEG